VERGHWAPKDRPEPKQPKRNALKVQQFQVKLFLFDRWLFAEKRVYKKKKAIYMKISAFLLYNSPGSCKVITAMGSGAISICRLWSFELW